MVDKHQAEEVQRWTVRDETKLNAASPVEGTSMINDG
jgi:hypothetical protein